MSLDMLIKKMEADLAVLKQAQDIAAKHGISLSIGEPEAPRLPTYARPVLAPGTQPIPPGVLRAPRKDPLPKKSFPISKSMTEAPAGETCDVGDFACAGKIWKGVCSVACGWAIRRCETHGGARYCVSGVGGHGRKHSEPPTKQRPILAGVRGEDDLDATGEEELPFLLNNEEDEADEEEDAADEEEKEEETAPPASSIPAAMLRQPEASKPKSMVCTKCSATVLAYEMTAHMREVHNTPLNPRAARMFFTDPEAGAAPPFPRK